MKILLLIITCLLITSPTLSQTYTQNVEKLTHLIQQKEDLEQKRSGLLVRYVPEHIEVKAVDAQIVKLDKEIKDLSAKVQSTAPNIPKAAAIIILDIVNLQAQIKTCGVSPNTVGCVDGSYRKKLAENYRKAVLYPDVMDFLVSQVLETSEQNKIIIAQNQRIIELLEKLANKK